MSAAPLSRRVPAPPGAGPLDQQGEQHDQQGPQGPGLDAPGGDTLVEEDLARRTEPTEDYRYDEGDHERFSHYAPKDKIMEAMVTGTPIRALCGKVWVPSRDPKRFPVCPVCKEVWETLPPGRGGQD